MINLTDSAELGEKLKMESRHEEAAHVLERYAKDLEGALDALVLGGVWEKAILLVRIHISCQ